MNTEWNITARIMGLDLGGRRIGVAVSDSLGMTAQGICMIDRKDAQPWLSQLDQLMEEYSIEEIVIGLPRNMNGSLGPKGEESQYWAKELGDRYQLPVHLWDERLSTVAVERTLIEANVKRKKRKHYVDQLAASWILQGYLDAQRRPST